MDCNSFVVHAETKPMPNIKSYETVYSIDEAVINIKKKSHYFTFKSY